MPVSALITDFYELTMCQGYYLSGNNPKVVFDMFYRNNPYQGGYVLFAGLQDFLDKLESFKFSKADIAFLKKQQLFSPEFLDYLSTYQFSGTVFAMDEGTVVFPGEPLIRIEANLIDAQLIESLILNTINFQSLIATKASRMALASKGGNIMEFGLRRAQGTDGALSASRAAFIGGVRSTSNTYAAKYYDIPLSGTMAHSWVSAFDSELEAFRTYAKYYPNNCILLIDTYDTLGSGIENAIIVGKELQSQGKPMGVRLDSGDLSYLPRVIRTRLDEAGLPDVFITVSNDLTEEIIQTLLHEEVPIDAWGIGTHLVTGGSQSSLNGVYKLSAKQKADGSFFPTMKISNSYEKTTNPGKKQVWRFFDSEGSMLADLVALDDEPIDQDSDYMFFHPIIDSDFFLLKKTQYTSCKPMLTMKMQQGKKIAVSPTLKEIQCEAKHQLSLLHASFKRQINPHVYKVSLSEKLKTLKKRLILESRIGK